MKKINLHQATLIIRGCFMDSPVMEKVVSGIHIIVKRGSITEEDVDALVNVANSHMFMGGGVAAAIKRAGGNIIEEEALRQAPIPIGRAIATTGGRLKARFVIHAPTMVRPGPTSPKNIYNATRAALEVAEKVGAQSIAIPGMGTGIGKVPVKMATEAILGAIKDFLEKGTRIKRIVLIDINKSMVEGFKRSLEALPSLDLG